MKNLNNYGQHFLTDMNVVNRFIELTEITKENNVIEIGPGNGILTKELCEKAKTVTCYEIDKSLKKELKKLKFDNLKIIYENFLDVDLNKADIIVSALPYQILEPFLKKLIDIDFNKVILITGYNFAHSLFHEEYLNDNIKFTNLLMECFFFFHIYDDIDAKSFSPSPKTLSSIVEIVRLDKELYFSNQQVYLMRELIEQRDKKIKNALIEALINYYKLGKKKITRNKAKEIICRLNIYQPILEKSILNLSNKELVDLYLIFKNNSVHL